MRVDYFLTTPKRVAVTPFRFKGISPTPFAIAPYDYCCRYSGFPPLFSCLQLDVNLVVEGSPSTKVPYGLRNTLGCFPA